MTTRDVAANEGLPDDSRAAIVTRLREAPVRLAVLFGSYATGDADPGSDIDIAVAYDESVQDETGTHVTLVADLTRLVGRDDVDVVRLTSVDPRIAVEALEEGERLVGTAADVTALREQLDEARRRRAETVATRVADAERAIERRLERREHG